MSLRDFLLDPVAVKEVSGLSRRWQTFAGRCVYVVLIGVIVWIFWRKFDRDQVFPTLSDYARLGRDLF
ncbi:MAG: hypothetical protein HY293_00095, partial [Planctomycetes bacterium]|nr:hypothetical protein [Planctomycetota bacterium]